MAKNKEEAQLKLKVESEGDKKIGFIKKALGDLAAFTAKSAAILSAAYAATTAAIVKFGKSGVEFRNVQNSFRELAASQGQDSEKMLSNMRDLSAGTIKDLDLMRQANNALLLGLPVDKFGDMVKIARGAAVATGQSMEFMLQSIVTGLGRGSKLMLDNLGILVDQRKANEDYARSLGVTAESLTDQQRKQAFVNAALKAGTENLEKQGGLTKTASDKWAGFGVRIQNIKDKLSTLLIPAFREVNRTTEGMVKSLEKVAGSNLVREWAVRLTKGFVIINVTLETFTEVIKQRVIPALGDLAELFSLAFREAKNAIPLIRQELTKEFSLSGAVIEIFVNRAKENLSSVAKVSPEAFKGTLQRIKELSSREGSAIGDIIADQKRVLNERLAKIDSDFAELEADNDKKRLEEKGRRALEAQELMNQQKSELQEIQLAEDEIKKEEEKERERLFREAMKNIDLEQNLDRLNQKILAEQDHNKKLELVRKRDLLKQKAINDQKKKEESELHQFKKMLASEEVRTAQSVFGQISTLASSKNKTLVALGKAAAIANITISTAQGVAKAFSLGPILGPILAPIVVAAGVAQAAKVSGVQLADGGIVKASQGGTHAIIGEGGRDEAVVPLEGGFGGITVHFNGPVLGDESQAREFALKMDEEFVKLRQNNESQAFDEDIT